MKFIKTIIASLGLGLLVQLVPSAYGFALLGPFAPWMQASNGVYYPYDIGGPMDIGSGYRWNVPVITYGFDKSFLDYFGSNGVTAVESAIKTLNNLPPAAQLEPTNYPIITEQWNYAAQVQEEGCVFSLRPPAPSRRPKPGPKPPPRARVQRCAFVSVPAETPWRIMLK